MALILETAEKTLLAPFDLETAKLERVFGTLAARKVDYADLYFQYSRFEGWSLEEGIVKSGSFNIDQGVGVRAVSGEKTAFAYSDEISFDALQDAAKATRAIAAAGQARRIKSNVSSSSKVIQLYKDVDPIASLPSNDKVALLEKLEKKCRALDPRVTQVMASLGGEYEVVLIARADGMLAADVRPLVRLSVQVIAEHNGRRESGSGGGGGRTDYSHFTDAVLDGYARQAVSQALVNLESRPAPAGTMTVVLGPGWPGVLLHEAVGHGLEGDFNRKGSSAFSGRLGERVASRGVTVVDDGTLPNRRGSLTVDDEGTPTSRTVLIEDGVLRGYLQDSLNARLMKMPLTGNGRRESFAHMTMPRMTNTYMLAGSHDPKEIIRSVKKGIYCANFSNGQVKIGAGDFSFYVKNGYLIEDGKLTRPIKDVNIIGNGPKVLSLIDMVADDLKIDEGGWTCGKNGQSVPVSQGMPTVRVSSITV
ncbi:MAG TPA: metalloprotease TldD, partial [Burkholderiales bacterium]|nr:metalloprotease TldD [Burkholderiales bacterium]